MSSGVEEALWKATATLREWQAAQALSLSLSFSFLHCLISFYFPLLLPLSLSLSYSMKISTLFLGMGSNGAFHWEIHLGFWIFQGVFGPMSSWARQHLFSWIPNGRVSPESNACSERRYRCYYHHGDLATSFSLGDRSLSLPLAPSCPHGGTKWISS